MYLRAMLVSTLAILLLGGVCVAQSEREFDPVPQDWFEITVSGGWNAFASGANKGNRYGSTPLLFDDGRDAGPAMGMEASLRVSDRVWLGFGLTVMTSKDEAVSVEQTDPIFGYPSIESYSLHRKASQALLSPQFRIRTEVMQREPFTLYVNVGAALILAFMDYSWDIYDLSTGNESASRTYFGGDAGAVFSAGLVRDITDRFSVGGELGYREFPEIRLSTLELDEVNDAGNSLLSYNKFTADYGGVYGLVTLSFRP